MDHKILLGSTNEFDLDSCKKQRTITKFVNEFYPRRKVENVYYDYLDMEDTISSKKKKIPNMTPFLKYNLPHNYKIINNTTNHKINYEKYFMLLEDLSEMIYCEWVDDPDDVGPYYVRWFVSLGLLSNIEQFCIEKALKDRKEYLAQQQS